MVGRKKNSTPEVRGNERFFYTKIFFIFDFSYFLEKWLQRHLVAVLLGQKFSSGQTQYSSIVSKTWSKSQGKLIDIFFSFSNEEYFQWYFEIPQLSPFYYTAFGGISIAWCWQKRAEMAVWHDWRCWLIRTLAVAIMHAFDYWGVFGGKRST